MAVEIDSLKKVSPLPLDGNTMRIDGTPFTSLSEAHNSIDPSNIAQGDTRLILENGELTEYWYSGGTAITDLIKKQPKLLPSQLESLANSDYQYQYFLSLISESLDKYGQSWVSLNHPVVGQSSNGGQIDIPNKTLTVPIGQTGANTYLSTTFKLDTFADLKIGDEVTLKSTIVENTPNTVTAENIKLTVYVNGTLISYIPEVVQNGLVIEYSFKYTISNLNDSIEFRHTVNSTNPVQSVVLGIAWVNIFVNYDKQKFRAYKDVMLNYADKFITWNNLFPRQPVYSKCIANGVTDDTIQLQKDIDEAIITSRVLILREGTYRITGEVFIRGYLEIKGIGKNKTTIYCDASSNIFTLQTPEGPIFRDFKFTRNTSTLPVAIRFTDFATTVGTRVVNVDFNGVTYGILVDHCDGLTVDGCKFDNGTTRSVVWGYTNISSVKNLTIKNCTFTSINGFSIELLTFNNVVIDNNLFNSINTTFSDMCIRVNVSEASSNTSLHITNNKFYGFDIGGVYITSNTSISGISLKNIYITDNELDEKSSGTNADSILISGGANQIVGVNIARNIIYNKRYGIYTVGVVGLSVDNNTIIGLISTSKSMNINGGTFKKGPNFVSNQQAGFTLPLYASGAVRVSDTSANVRVNSFTIPSLATGASSSTNVTVTGARLSTPVRSTFDNGTTGLNGRICYSSVTANDTITVTFFNPTSTTIPASTGILVTTAEFNI